MYEGTIVAYDWSTKVYGISWDDGDYTADNEAVTIPLIDRCMVKTGQMSARDRIQEGSPFALMQLNTDSLERKAAARGAFPFLVLKHCTGLSFELRDHPLPTVALSIELQQCLGTSLDKILLLCEEFPAGSDEVYILRNFACIIPQLLFVYGTHTEQVSEQSTSLIRENGKTSGK